jgi:regulator of ribonuclease activity A
MQLGPSGGALRCTLLGDCFYLGIKRLVIRVVQSAHVRAVSLHSNQNKPTTRQKSVMKFHPTCDVYDALLDKARVPEVQWVNYGGKKQFCGRVAATVQCNDDNSWVKTILEASVETTAQSDAADWPKILVADGSGSRRCALLGDQIAAAAIRNGWAGIVIYGCVRDVDALASLPLGVAAIGCTPRKSYRGAQPTGARNGTIQIGGVSVHVGDAVYVDNDGVVFARRHDVDHLST